MYKHSYCTCTSTRTVHVQALVLYLYTNNAYNTFALHNAHSYQHYQQLSTLSTPVFDYTHTSSAGICHTYTPCNRLELNTLHRYALRFAVLSVFIDSLDLFAFICSGYKLSNSFYQGVGTPKKTQVRSYIYYTSLSAQYFFTKSCRTGKATYYNIFFRI